MVFPLLARAYREALCDCTLVSYKSIFTIAENLQHFNFRDQIHTLKSFFKHVRYFNLDEQ
jgi:hypothetical protein